MSHAKAKNLPVIASIVFVAVILASCSGQTATNAEPVEPILAPAQPAFVAPTTTREPLPVLKVEWEPMVDAPTAHALFVQDGILYAVEDTPSGCITWGYENDAWVSRPATADESQLVVDRDWRDFEDLMNEVFGPTHPYGSIKLSSKETFTMTRGPMFDGDNRQLPRLFININNQWAELSAPNDGIAYGLIVIDKIIFVSIDGQIWQAQLKNLP